jgi:hypothetical protein
MSPSYLLWLICQSLLPPPHKPLCWSLPSSRTTWPQSSWLTCESLCSLIIYYDSPVSLYVPLLFIMTHLWVSMFPYYLLWLTCESLCSLIIYYDSLVSLWVCIATSPQTSSVPVPTNLSYSMGTILTHPMTHLWVSMLTFYLLWLTCVCLWPPPRKPPLYQCPPISYRAGAQSSWLTCESLCKFFFILTPLSVSMLTFYLLWLTCESPC